MRSTYGWAEISEQRKNEIVEAIASGTATRAPIHAELDLTDRCNVACYFCNQQDVRTKEFVSLDRVRAIIDELAEGGLRSVRMSGGGDPLYHRNITEILDKLSEHGVVIDNLTTNAALMGPEVSARLVRDRAREVVVSLNAADPEDYQRMMKVKPAIFDRVVENVRHLVDTRKGDLPWIVMQFLLDRENFDKLPLMYDVAREARADTISVSFVLDIPLERIDRERLLDTEDLERVRPYVQEVLERDREDKILQMGFPPGEWNEMVEHEKQKLGIQLENFFPTAPSFSDENGGCFFGWYTMTIRGNGDLYPCCMLMSPDYEPLGNATTGSILDHWRGEKFTRLRSEMREVLLRRGKVFFRPSRFRVLRKHCVEPHACWLKNNYFRGDEAFYSQLGEALEKARVKEVGFFGRPAKIGRAIEAFAWDNQRLRDTYESVRLRTRGLRKWMKSRLGLNVSGASLRDR